MFTSIGTSYGVGDGSTTFNIPDFRGEFLRGWDHGRGVDTSRGIGTWQDQAYKDHSHGLGAKAVLVGIGGGSFATATGVGDPIGLSSGGAFTGGTETRPRNVAVLYCIKY